jgi:hypothetical protein
MCIDHLQNRIILDAYVPNFSSTLARDGNSELLYLTDNKLLCPSRVFAQVTCMHSNAIPTITKRITTIAKADDSRNIGFAELRRLFALKHSLGLGRSLVECHAWGPSWISEENGCNHCRARFSLVPFQRVITYRDYQFLLRLVSILAVSHHREQSQLYQLLGNIP